MITNTPRRGLFLDLDGTLADSLGVLWEIYLQILQRFGHLGNRAEFDSLNGPKLSDIAKILHRKYSLPGEPEDILALYNRLIDEAYLQIGSRPGVLPLLELAANSGWVVTIVTSNTSLRTRAWLEARQLLPYITHIVTGDQVTRGKPFPDLYLRAIAIAGCAIAQSWVVEDSPQGAQAAVAAGLFTYVCLNDAPPDAAWPTQVRFINSLEELIPAL